MAQYERDFLVPYLEDVCALYMCENILARKVYKTTRDIIEITAQPTIKRPQRPECEEPWEKNKGKVIGSIVAFFVAILVISSDPGYGGSLDRAFRSLLNMAFGFVAVVSVIVFISAIVDIFSTKRFNEQVWAEYQEESSRFNRQWNTAMAGKEKQRKELLPSIQKENDRYSKDLKECQNLLVMLYDADVIPTKYRNKYAMMYLYDWFKHNRRADDLDLALNTFVLEQIKERLDKMIEQMEEIIVNQRIAIANQRQSMEEQRRHYAYMENKARTIIANQEEQSQYLEMLESNMAVSAFFNTASYLKNNK